MRHLQERGLEEDMVKGVGKGVRVGNVVGGITTTHANPLC